MIIREDVSRHMRELKAWLAQTEDVPLEEMAAFFSARLSDYEEHMSIWREAYITFERLLPQDVQTVLDLGCGTGLELDVLLAKRPHLQVTGVDLCPDMLDRLRRKHPQVHALCADYFAHELGENCYDAVINFETLHHFTPEQKGALYARIHRALRPGGMYLQAEYVACCDEEEELLWDTLRRKRERDGIPEKQFVHFDAPLTLEHELALLRAAGFQRPDAPDCINGACFLRSVKA